MTMPFRDWLGRLRDRIRSWLGLPPPAPLTERQKTGVWGEDIAVKQLRKEGYAIAGRRVRPDARNDEIDIVARKGNVLAFVEVKTRRDERFGRPALAVDRRKRQALCRGAAAFIRRANNPAFTYRFDIVEVIGSRTSPDPPVVRHIEDAFRFPPNRRFVQK
ncbi:MAG: YraN family protein [Kiritimatiellae bacterium]|nr:YraN family protein [Kiritimatiellia bacterium]